jgi:O-antigen biosynthesis protein
MSEQPGGHLGDPPERTGRTREEELRDQLDGLALIDRLGHLIDEVRRRDLEIAEAEREISRLTRARDELNALLATKTMRYLAPLRQLYGRVQGRRWRAVDHALPTPAVATTPTAVPPGREADSPEVADVRPQYEARYGQWIDRYDTLDDRAVDAIRQRVAALTSPPLISVVMPVYDPDPAFLAAAISSVRDQLYPHWELCLADDASRSTEVVAFLEDVAAQDRRIKLTRRSVRGNISEATNTALEMADGAWVAFLDHDDVLPKHALADVAFTVVDHPGAKLIYSDEDKLDARGTRCQPYFKPDFDLKLLLGQNYLAHLRVIRRDVLAEVGACRIGFEGSQDWDLHLRLAEVLSDDEVVHIPHVLYHWRIHDGSTAASLDAKPQAAVAACRAVGEHLERTGARGSVTSVLGGWCRVQWEIPDPPPLVSIVICTRDGTHLRTCIESIWARSTYPRFEIAIVDNGSVRPGTEALLAWAAQRGATVLHDARTFNFSALNNAAAKKVAGDLICFLNDDTEVISPNWLEEMVGQATQPGVSVVGAKLYYPRGAVQHAGVVTVPGGIACHVLRGADRLDRGYFGRSALVQQFSAVTGAAMLVRRDAFESMGGFEEDDLAVAFNDVDLCLRLRGAGWRVVWTPFAELFHHESATRGLDSVSDERFANEIACMERRWSHVLDCDPFFNVNLDIGENGVFTMAWPPRGGLPR